jgi:hypothetical protein
MLFILIASALVVMVAVLGLSICRVAALSDRNSALAVTEWIATRHLSDRQAAFPGRSGEQSLLDPPGEVFRTAG